MIPAESTTASIRWFDVNLNKGICASTPSAWLPPISVANRARCPVRGGAGEPDKEEPTRTCAHDRQRRGCESDADKARDPKDGGSSHEHRSAFFADKTVFEGKGQQAQGAGALDGELREEGAVPSGLS